MISWIRNQLRKIKNFIYKSYDKRPFLGLPGWYKGFKLPK